MHIQPELIERTQRFLFASENDMEEAGLTNLQRERLLRLRETYVWWIQNPQKTDRAVAERIRQKYGIGVSRSYDDVQLLKVCIGNLQQTTRNWCQHLFLQRCEEGFEMARRQKDANAFARVLSALGKFTRLDRDEHFGPDYSLIVPQRFEITTDPSVAGFERIPDIQERAHRLLERFRRETEMAEANVVQDVDAGTPIQSSI